MQLKPIDVNPGTWFQAHEFAEDYPLLEGPPLWTMADSMKKTGFYPANPIVLWRNRDGDLQVLDGRRRQLAAKRLGIDPPFVECIGTDLEALAYVEAMNYHRRHLGEADRESISKKTVGRRALLAGMAATAESGKSPKCRNSDTTAIPPTTLAEAAKEQGISRDTAAQGKLVVIKGTEEQKQAVISGERSVSDVATEIRNGKAEPGQATDCEGHPVTEATDEAFRNLERFEQLDSLARQMQKQIDELSTLPGGEQLRRWLRPTGAEGKTINRSEHLDLLKQDLKGTRPHSVCPWCAGQAKNGCKGCNGTGWVTATTWKDAPEDIKRRLT
jgi:hypothetical protein